MYETLKSFFLFIQYYFEFDSILTKKVPRSAPMADLETFLSFAIVRYTIYF